MKLMNKIVCIFMTGIICLFSASCARDKNSADPAEDDTVYHSKFYSKNAIYFKTRLSHEIGMVPVENPGEAYYACLDPACRHNSYECPLYSVGITGTLVVEREGTMPMLYTFSKPCSDYYEDGEYRQLTGDEMYINEIKAYDTATGQSRTVGRTPPANVREAWLYRGKLYMWANGCRDGGASVRVYMADAETGEYAALDSPERTKVIGISDERVWFITERGMIGSCALDLSDLRDEYEIGPEPLRLGEETTLAVAESGVIYFERNCRNPEEFGDDPDGKFYMISDIYALDTRDISSGERLVVLGAQQFRACGGDLYYTLIDYEVCGTVPPDEEHEEELTIRRIDGGTMYMYDHESGQTKTLFSDIGTNFEEIFDLNEDFVLFRGLRYRDVESCPNRNGQDLLCLCDLKTGEWGVLTSTGDLDDPYGGI